MVLTTDIAAFLPHLSAIGPTNKTPMTAAAEYMPCWCSLLLAFIEHNEGKCTLHIQDSFSDSTHIHNPFELLGIASSIESKVLDEGGLSYFVEQLLPVSQNLEYPSCSPPKVVAMILLL
jgi:hypothetical protein